jgi:predicted Zn finger-like uncharacterized protein
MSIDLECPACWRAISFDDDQAGKEVRCPRCLNRFQLPGSESAGYSLAAEVACPGCRKPVTRGAVICIECGYDFRTGKTHHREVEEKEVVQKADGLRFHFRRDRRGRWTLELGGALRRSGGTEYNLRRYSALIAVHRHDGWDDNDGEVALFLEAPDGKRERIYDGENVDLVNWLEGMFRDEVGLKVRDERA